MLCLFSEERKRINPRTGLLHFTSLTQRTQIPTCTSYIDALGVSTTLLFFFYKWYNSSMKQSYRHASLGISNRYKEYCTRRFSNFASFKPICYIQKLPDLAENFLVGKNQRNRKNQPCLCWQPEAIFQKWHYVIIILPC